MEQLQQSHLALLLLQLVGREVLLLQQLLRLLVVVSAGHQAAVSSTGSSSTAAVKGASPTQQGHSPCGVCVSDAANSRIAWPCLSARQVLNDRCCRLGFAYVLPVCSTACHPL